MAGKIVGFLRNAARDAGEKYYFTGKPCKNGHLAKRQVTNGVCVECAKTIKRRYQKAHPQLVLERNRKWRDNHPDWGKEQNRKYYRNNKEKHLAGQKVWRSENQEKIKADKIKWREENRDAHRAQRRNRNARKRQNGGTHSAADILDILRMQKSKCACCGLRLGKSYHVDHIIPLSKGGSNDRRNLQILCVKCNLSKSKADPIDFMRSKGMLL